MTETETVLVLIAEIDGALAQYRQGYKGLTWREKVLLLTGVSKSLRMLAAHTDPTAAGVKSRERIRLYLQAHVSQVIDAVELEVVSGISDYGRRIRELRVQDGYKIITGHSNDPEAGFEIKPSQYVLIDPAPDTTAARRWHIANRIRRDKQSGSQGRMLKFLLENVGQIVTTEELAYVAKARQFARRVRELRTEQGYAIATKFTGRPDLRMSEYVLDSSKRVAEPHDRHIDFEVQKQVYERDHNACRLCGWNRERWNRDDPRILELHHVMEHARSGANTANNLIVLCSRCHDDIHAHRQDIPSGLVP